MATKAIDARARSTSRGSVSSRRIRKIFGNIHEISEMPNLIEVQRESYEQFLRSDPKTGYVSGLEKTLRSVFPIQDFAGVAHLDFDRYELEEPKYDTDECRQRGMTFAAPMRVTLRLTSFEIDPDTETKSVIDIKEQDVYMGDMPLMTKNGTFIVNGTERVIVSQMHRSPGVLFDHDRGKTHASGKFLFAARVIPYRGSWLDFEFDAKDIVNVRIDRKRKLPVTALLHALGLTSEEILNTFYNRVTWSKSKGKYWAWRFPDAASGASQGSLEGHRAGRVACIAADRLHPVARSDHDRPPARRGHLARRAARRHPHRDSVHLVLALRFRAGEGRVSAPGAHRAVPHATVVFDAPGFLRGDHPLSLHRHARAALRAREGRSGALLIRRLRLRSTSGLINPESSAGRFKRYRA
jgi:DNA-directed RNA polymerase beta subunit